MLFRITAASICVLLINISPCFPFKGEKNYLIPYQAENGNWGYRDTDGRIVIKARYKKALDFKDGLALVSLFNKYGYIDMKGRRAIPFEFDNAKSFSEGLAAVMVYDMNNNKKWGYINKSGRFVVRPIYDEVSDFSNGSAEVKVGDNRYVINTTGDLIEKSYD